MSNPFHPDDAGKLLAPLETFAGGWDAPPGGKNVSATHARRAALALEVACQLAKRIPGIVLKGGTPLQARLGWPPARASIDVDLEWHDTTEVMNAVHDLADVLSRSGVRVQEVESLPLADKTYLTFPLAEAGSVVATRIDIAPPGTSTEFCVPWDDLPDPWSGTGALRVPPLEAHAAQKLLLACEAPFGRDTNRHEGRQNLMKDWFDLQCLGGLDLDSDHIAEIADAEVVSKAKRMGGDWDLARVVASAQATYRRMAPARADTTAVDRSLWKAYLTIRPYIRDPYSDGDLRKAAGCAHHAVTSLLAGDLDWVDAWTPARTGQPRKAWDRQAAIQTWLDVPDDYGAAIGLRESWARPGRHGEE